jgi:hypothetical protein
MIINIVRKPLIGSVCENIALHNIGGINIDDTRIATEDGKPPYEYKNGAGGVYSHDYQKNSSKAKEWNNFSTERDNPPVVGSTLGRWGSNVILSESAVEPISIQGGESASVVRNPTGNSIYSTENTSVVWNSNNVKDTTVRGYSDSGSVVRYFKVVKEK